MSTQFKPGDDFIWDGATRRAGVIDFTGYTAHAAVKARDEGTGEPTGDPLAETAAIALAVDGTFVVDIPKEVTAEWEVGQTLLIDVVITDADGKVYTSGTGEFDTVQRVTDAVLA
jgi:hypothetical protein